MQTPNVIYGCIIRHPQTINSKSSNRRYARYGLERFTYIALATARCDAIAIRLDQRERNLRHKPFLKRAGSPRERSRANSTSKMAHGSCHLP